VCRAFPERVDTRGVVVLEIGADFKKIGPFRFFIVVSLQRQTGMTALFDLLLHTENRSIAACERFAKRFVCMRRLFFVTLCGIYE
jgi:hypothetical protein